MTLNADPQLADEVCILISRDDLSAERIFVFKNSSFETIQKFLQCLNVFLF